MSKIDIFLLDNSNNTKDEIKIIKPENYKELLKQIGQKMKYMPKYYEMFIFDKNNKEIKIINDRTYNKIDDILFIREVDKNILEQSLFEINYNILSESRQEKLDDIYNCILCSTIIKNENPYLCYQCQKIFHEKCVKDWDKKCKSQNKVFKCPNCRNELPLEKWNKKVNYEDNRKESGNLMNKIKEFKLNNNMNKNINLIKDKKINELMENQNNQIELINNYEKYMIKTREILQNIIDKIKSIHSLLKLKENNKLNNPINLKNYSELDKTSNIIYDELELFKNYIIDNQKINVNVYKKININRQNHKDINIKKNENELILDNIKENKEEKVNQDNIKEKLTNFLFNFAEFINEMNSSRNNIIKKENFVYLVHKDFLIKYLGKYNLKYSFINDKILIKDKALYSIKNSIKEYIDKEFKILKEAIYGYNNINLINKENINELPFIIVKNNSEKIYYYNNYFLLNEKTIKILDIDLVIFPKLEYYSKEKYIFLFQQIDQGTIVDIGKLDSEKAFKTEYLINTTKDTKYLIYMVNSKTIELFFLSYFLFRINDDISKYSPFFDDEYNIIGNAYLIEEGFKNYSNSYYNPILVNVIFLIKYFKFPKYEFAKINSENYFFLINEKWMKNFKNKYMYQTTKREIEKNQDKNISTIINTEQKNKKLLIKLIYLIIVKMDELNKKYNSINNLVLEDIPSEPECESLKDFNGGKEFFFYNNFYILDEDIHNRIFNLNEQQSKEMKKKNNYCKCFYADGYFFIILNNYLTQLSKVIIEVGNFDEEQKFNLIYLIVFNSKKECNNGIDIMQQFGFKNYFNFIKFNKQNIANLYIDELGKINGYIYLYSKNKNDIKKKDSFELLDI